jgi:opine dehydrogenase
MRNKLINFPRFAVIGAGNCGQAMAAHLTSLGFEVNLYNRSKGRIDAIKKGGGIKLRGILGGLWMPSKVTTNMKEAIEGVDIIMVVIPASGHKDIAKACTPYLKDGQTVILNPGRTFGALEFLNVIRKNRLKVRITIAETQTTIYTARLIKDGEVEVLALKNSVSIASIPANQIIKIIDALRDIYPQLVPAKNVLITSMDNIGAILHPTPTLFNVGWIEKTNALFKHYYDAISPTVAKFLEKLDGERMEVAKALGVKAMSTRDWIYATYGVKADTLYNALQNNEKYSTIDALTTIQHRYIFEDIPTGLVPIASLGEMLGVDTPNIKLVIEQASSLLDVDFWKIGRTVEKLGLKGLSVDEITKLVEEGKV